ncbi:hypothetical protein ACIRBY_25475 [Streptomyces sp. NPDC096136]|uniref:hypothetical protein n=1 Tax=Streptomyces sp. NPDC096136 TaxID=3366076 RepID=UPI003805F95F
MSGLLTDHGNGPHITVPVPPGEHVLDEARVAYGSSCEWRDAEAETPESTAVRLRLSETPAASFEPLLSLFERGLTDGEPDLDGYEGLTDKSMFTHRTGDTATGGELASDTAYVTCGGVGHLAGAGLSGSPRRGPRVP